MVSRKTNTIQQEITSPVVTLLQSKFEAYTEVMRRLACLIALLLLLSAAAPVLACVTGSAMNHEENACCRAMHGNCGKMAKTGCCKTEVRTDEHPQIATRIQSIDLHWVVVNWLTPTIVAFQTSPHSLFSAPDEHSPPGLLTANTTVLRI
ncbi:MAG: hypothetical protein ABSA39_22160 [Edaphobacter sp.]